MKLLLTSLNSKYIHSNLAIRYLYNIAEGADFKVEMKEFTINNNMDYIYTEILRPNYDYVCFSCYIWNIEQIKELGNNLKKANPNLKILVGGPEVSYEAEKFMKENQWVDYIIKGEGEVPFFQFCRNLVLEDEDFQNVGSLVYKNNSNIIQTPMADLPSMEQIPFPYQLLDVDYDKVIYYESSRGCPYRCSYCLSSLDKRIRAKSIQHTCRDLGYFLFKKVKQVKFIDRTFNFNSDRAYEIWQYIIENDNGVTNFHFEICGELLNDKTLMLLNKARTGLFQFEIGIQSANPIALKTVNRKENIYPILYNVERLIAMNNSHIHVDLIAGLPFEDYRSFARSFNKIYQLGADNLQLGFLKLLKGTDIRDKAEKYGYVFRDKAPYEVISNNFMSATDFIKLKMIETVLDLYCTRGGFKNTISFLEGIIGKSAFNFYEQLADFYYENGFQDRSHKKEDLYRILLKFAQSKKKEDKECLEEIKQFLEQDLSESMNFDAVKKFYKKGWEI